jgi:hypothetical protein
MPDSPVRSTSNPEPGLNELVGSWQLLSIRYVFSDTSETVDPFDPTHAGAWCSSPGAYHVSLRERPVRD